MATSNDSSRRVASRIAFRMPRPGRFATREVVLIDLSLKGAGIRHQVRIAPGTKSTLRFRLERQYHEVQCELLRSKLELVNHGNKITQIYRSGLRFSALDDELAGMKDALRKRIQRAVARQQADAFADPGLMSGIDEPSGSLPLDLLASWMESRPFVRCTLERGRWKKERSDSAEQPGHGFTVSAEEGEKEIDILCQAYQKSSEEQRRLIRLFAHLSVSDPSDEPRGRFEP